MFTRFLPFVLTCLALYGQTPTFEAAASADSLIGAVQAQLGLKLERKKGQAEVLVVDHMEKTPTEN